MVRRIGLEVTGRARRRPSPGRRPPQRVCHASGWAQTSASCLLRRIRRGDRIGVDEGLTVVAGSRPAISASHCRPITSRRSSDRIRPWRWSAAIGRRSTFASSGSCRSRTARAACASGWYLVSRVVSHLQLGEHRRAGVAAAELAHLPLLGQHPQRVAHFGAQRAIEALSCAAAPSSRFQVVIVGNSRRDKRCRECRRPVAR